MDPSTSHMDRAMNAEKNRFLMSVYSREEGRQSREDLWRNYGLRVPSRSRTRALQPVTPRRRPYANPDWLEIKMWRRGLGFRVPRSRLGAQTGTPGGPRRAAGGRRGGAGGLAPR